MDVRENHNKLTTTFEFRFLINRKYRKNRLFSCFLLHNLN